VEPASDSLSPSAPPHSSKKTKTNFCCVNDRVERKQRQAATWRKIFANHMPGKGFVFRIKRTLKIPHGENE